MINTIAMPAMLGDADAELVAQSLAGNRDAFGRIVARYQSLICALAYSATGSLGRSEEVAQETFLTAWKQLHSLREPHRLRSWLCGIARHRISDIFRSQAREPACGAEPLEAVQDTPSNESLPSEQAISREEEAILWRSLERIPDSYREPLVLFYREHRSVEEVAQALELSPDAVKQRLARGRKMLHEEVAAYVESALERTAPGKTFTLGVLAALPVLAASSATAATVAGGTAAKVTLAAKAAAAAGLAGAVLGTLGGLLGATIGGYMSVSNTRSARERAFMIRQVRLGTVAMAVFLAAFLALIFLGKRLVNTSPVGFGCLLGASVAVYLIGMIGWARWINRRQQQIQLEDGTAGSWQPPQPQSHSSARRRWWLGALWGLAMQGAPAPGLPPAPFPNAFLSSRARKRFMAYGSTGGSAVGAFSWLIIQAIQAGDWITATVTILFGIAVALLCGRALVRRPENRIHILLRALALFGLFTLLTCALHWRDWTKAAGVQTTALEGILIGSGLTFVAVFLAGFAWLRSRWARAEKGSRQ